MNQQPDTELLTSLLRADAATLQPTLPSAAQVLWRHQALRRLTMEDRQARRAVFPARLALVTSVLVAITALAMLLLTSGLSGLPNAARSHQLVGWLPMALAIVVGPAALVAFLRARRAIG